MVTDCNLTAEEYAFAAKIGKQFSPEVLREIIWSFIVEKEKTDISDAGRWDIRRSAIITFNGVDFYRVYWSMGLTEYQEDEYWSQVLEPVRKVKTVITVEEWETIKCEQ